MHPPARFLSPAQFGIFVMISAINVLKVRLAEAGWREFETAWDGAEDADAHAFTLATIGGIGLTLVGLLGAGILMLIPGLQPYVGLQVLLSLSLLGIGTSATWSGYLIRTQRAQLLAKAMLVSQLAGGVVSVGGLVEGWGLLALGAGKLVTQWVLLLVLAAVVRWFPGFRLSSSGLTAIVEYTKSMLGSKLIGYLYANAAPLIIGVFLGPGAVGLYRAGARVSGSIAEVVNEPLRIISWMNLRRAVDSVTDKGNGEGSSKDTAKERPEDLGARARALTNHSERFLALSVCVATPVYVGLATTSETLIASLLGDKWVDCATVVSVLAVARVISTPQLITPPLLSLAGFVQKLPALNVIAALATITTVPLFAPFGIVATAVGQLAAAVVISWAFGRAQRLHGSVSWWPALSNSIASGLASLAMAAAILGYRVWGAGITDNIHLQLGAEILVGLLVFLALFSVLGGWRQLAWGTKEM